MLISCIVHFFEPRPLLQNNLVETSIMAEVVGETRHTVEAHIKKNRYLGVQADFVLIHRVFSAKLAWKCS